MAAIFLGCQPPGTTDPVLSGVSGPLAPIPADPALACALPVGDTIPEVPPVDLDAGPDALFADDALPLFEVLLDDDGWGEVCRNASDYADYLWAIGEDLAPERSPHAYTQADLIFQGKLYEDVGVRFRGRTTVYALFYSLHDNRRPNGLSRCRDHLAGRKPSWKIKLDKFGQDYEIAGQQTFNLAAREGSDGAYLREVLAMKVANEFGVVAPWGGHARLCVDGQYEGLFSLVQEADTKRFLNQRFPEAPKGDYWKIENDGNQIWDPLWNADGLWVNDYGPVGRTSEDDPGALRDLLDVGTTIEAGELPWDYPIDAVIDVDQWLREIAIDLAIPDYDGMFGNHKNHLLYDHPDHGIQVVPYDKDLAFVDQQSYLGGVCPGDILGGHPCWSRVEEPPAVAGWLMERHGDRYLELLQELIDTVLIPETLAPWLVARAEAIRPWITADRYYGPDSPACIDAPITCHYYSAGAWEFEVDPLLTGAIQSRVAEIQRQLDGGLACKNSCVDVSGPQIGGLPPVRLDL